MEIFRGHQTVTRSFREPVVAIGNFDGVHLGHRQIVGTAVSHARARGGEAVVFTFRPHPSAVLRPDTGVELLTSYDQKLEELAKLGPDAVVEEPFVPSFYSLSPEAFFRDVLIGRLRAREIVVGFNFRFGKGRAGSPEALSEYSRAAGVTLNVIQAVRVGEEEVSSSRIRALLLAGDVSKANLLLGREYSYRGEVIHGDKRGRMLGFPTANMKIAAGQLALPRGVYATRTEVDGKVFPSVTNLGVRPTFRAEPGESGLLVETHLLEGGQDLYGKTIEVRFRQKLRDERKFSGIDELRAQIATDCSSARTLT